MVLGDSGDFDESKALQMQMGMGMAGGGPQQPPNPKTLFKKERENLNMCNHKWMVEDAEYRLLGSSFSRKEDLLMDGDAATSFDAKEGKAASTNSKSKRRNK